MTVTAREKEEKGGGELISLHHGPTADKEILFWGKTGFGQHNVCRPTLARTVQVIPQRVRLHVSVRNPLRLTNRTIVSVLISYCIRKYS